MSTKARTRRGTQKVRVPYIHPTKGKRSWAKSGGNRLRWGMNATLQVRR